MVEESIDETLNPLDRKVDKTISKQTQSQPSQSAGHGDFVDLINKIEELRKIDTDIFDQLKRISSLLEKIDHDMTGY